MAHGVRFLPGISSPGKCFRQDWPHKSGQGVEEPKPADCPQGGLACPTLGITLSAGLPPTPNQNGF